MQRLSMILAAGAVSMVCHSASAATGFSVAPAQHSTNGAGNTADTFASTYGAVNGLNFNGATPLVVVPDLLPSEGGDGESGVYQSPFNNTGGIIEATRDYFSIGGTASNGNGANSPVSLTLNNALTSLTMLWGSIDSYNSITFLAGVVPLLTVTGSDVATYLGLAGGPNFEHVAIVNFFTDLAFDNISFTSTQAAFEFGFSVSADPQLAVPLPAALPLFAAALGGLALLRYRRRQGTSSAHTA